MLRSDAIRKRLFGAPPTERLEPEAYSSGVSDRVYATPAERAGVAVRGAYSVIVDAVYASARDREAIERVAARSSVPFVGLWLAVPESIAMERAERRRQDASDADAAVIRMQLRCGLRTRMVRRLETLFADRLKDADVVDDVANTLDVPHDVFRLGFFEGPMHAAGQRHGAAEHVDVHACWRRWKAVERLSRVDEDLRVGHVDRRHAYGCHSIPGSASRTLRDSKRSTSRNSTRLRREPLARLGSTDFLAAIGIYSGSAAIDRRPQGNPSAQPWSWNAVIRSACVECALQRPTPSVGRLNDVRLD